MGELLNRAKVVRDETKTGANTAKRVGAVLVDLATTIEALPCEIQESTLVNKSIDLDEKLLHDKDTYVLTTAGCQATFVSGHHIRYQIGMDVSEPTAQQSIVYTCSLIDQTIYINASIYQ